MRKNLKPEGVKDGLWHEAENFLLKDKYISPLIKKYGHCEIKPRKHRDYFVSLVREITGQQLSGKVAKVIFGRLKERIKGKIIPDKILKLTAGNLRKCGMSWAKASYVRDLALKVKEGKLKTKKLDKLSDEEVTKELVSVKGIGIWTAKMFLMFSLARPDVFPAEDLGIQKGVEKLVKKKFQTQEVARFAERWKPFRTVASWYLWEFLENK